jgi:biotin carboxyl carrier protein
MHYKIKTNGVEYEVHIQKVEGRTAHLTVNGVDFDVEVEGIKVNPTRMSNAPVKVTIPSDTPVVKPKASQPTSLYELKSPLPGAILEINVSVGETVKEGQVVLVLEAMKMENNIQAERGGIVEKIYRTKGDAVLEGDVILTIK